MAYAMMGGIIVGTLLTLLFLPALYVAWFRIHPDHEDEPPAGKEEAPYHETPPGQIVANREPQPLLETQI